MSRYEIKLEDYKRAVSLLREALTEAHCALRETYVYAHMDAATVAKVQEAMEVSETALSSTDDISRSN